ncbi:hypothetical protein [Gemmatimonas sp.]|uniref:hypothetical protein n=1 Tax=Gemmatimonas sp. TaxID=1962908 RepID=UPI00333F098D
MAKYDDRRAPVVLLLSGTDTPTLTFAGTATAGDLIVLAFATFNTTLVAAPSGFTPIGSRIIAGEVNAQWFAKVATGSEGSSFSATFDSARSCGGIGFMLEGPFASTAAVSLSSVETSSGQLTPSVLNAPASLAQAGRALPFVLLPYGGIQPMNLSSWSNGFANVGLGGGSGAWLFSGTRTYATADSGVQTVGTFDSDGYKEKFLMLVTESAGSSLNVTSEPSNSWDDEVIRPPIVVTSSNSAFTGNVTLAIASGSGTLAGTTTVAAVAGVATFSNVRVQGSGSHTLTASASGHSSDTSAAFKVATGTGVPSAGAGVILLGGGMQRTLKDGETVASRKRLFFEIRDGTGAPFTGALTDVKAKLSYTGAAPIDSNADIVRVGGASHYVELTNSEAAAGAPGDVIGAWVPAASGRLESTHAFFEVTADDLSVASPTIDEVATATAAAVRDDQIDMLLDGLSFPSGSGDMTVKKSDGTTVTISVTRGTVSGGILGIA